MDPLGIRLKEAPFVPINTRYSRIAFHCSVRINARYNGEPRDFRLEGGTDFFLSLSFFLPLLFFSKISHVDNGIAPHCSPRRNAVFPKHPLEKVFQDLSYPTIFSKGNSSNLLLHTIYLHIRI